MTKTNAEEVADQVDYVYAAFVDIESGMNHLVDKDLPQYVQDALVKARNARELAHAAFLDLVTAAVTARDEYNKLAHELVEQHKNRVANQ